MTLISLSPNVFSLIRRCIYIYISDVLKAYFVNRTSTCSLIVQFPTIGSHLEIAKQNLVKFNDIDRRVSNLFSSWKNIYFFVSCRPTGSFTIRLNSLVLSSDPNISFLCFIIFDQLFETFANKNKNLELQIQG